MARLKSLSQLDNLFGEEIKTNKIGGHHHLELEVWTATSDEVDISDLLSLETGLVMVQGSYGSNFINISKEVEKAAIRSDLEFFHYDYYSTVSYLTPNIVLRDKNLFYEFIPQVKAMGRSGMKAALNKKQLAIFTTPSYVKKERDWAIENLMEAKCKTLIFCIEGYETAIRRHETSPKYKEHSRSFDSYIEEAINRNHLPCFREGWDRIIIYIDQADGPFYLSDGLVSETSILNSFSGCKKKSVAIPKHSMEN